MRRNSNGGTANFLACGCRACRDEMQREFARILDAGYTLDELTDTLANAKFLTDQFNLNPSLRKRIAAYSGPLPNATA